MKTDTDKRSDAARKYRCMYKTKRWQRLREAQLAKHPFCESPYHRGKYIDATVADHKQAHRGDSRLFHDPRNLMSLCASCHSFGAQARDISGHWHGHDERGFPLNQDAPWHEGVGGGPLGL